MRVRALRSFTGRYGHIREGSIFECEPGYCEQLARNRLVEKVAEGEEPAPTERKDPAPGANRNKPPAPVKAGKGSTGDQGTPPADTVPRAIVGRGIPARSLRADLQSRGKTSTKSEAGDSKDQTEATKPAGA